MMAQEWTFARSNLAAFLLENGRAAEALEFTTGHEHESVSMLKIHGKALFALSHYEEAVSTLEQAVELDGSEDDPLLVSLWMAQIFSGMHKAALKTARLGTRQFPADAQWNVRVGASLRELGRFDEARLAIEKALRKGLSTEEALRAEYDLARKQEDDEIALQVIEEMLALPGGRSEDGKMAWAERQYVQLLTRAGNLQAVRQFVEQCDLSAEGWAEAAWAVQDSCENELLLDLAEKALALDPRQLQGLLAQAEALGRLGREAEARAVLHQLTEEYPEEHTAYEKLALWMAVGGDPDTAFDYADRGVELGIFCPTAWATRGLIHALRGDVQAARDDLMAGWRRTGLEGGKNQIYFWWLLAGLEGEMDLAAERREQALRICRTTLEIRILRMIENMLAD
jgi:Flp pilus assembly protein TadD